MEESSAPLLRHVVMFKFKDESSEADVQSVIDAFAALPEKIPSIHAFEWGTDNSPEGLQDGFTHCFFLSFKSEEDRATYLPHPDHKAFGKVLGPHLDKVLVVDYWAK
ncbi:MAG: Dabb family protein [Bacteroidota bacterium]